MTTERPHIFTGYIAPAALGAAALIFLGRHLGISNLATFGLQLAWCLALAWASGQRLKRWRVLDAIKVIQAHRCPNCGGNPVVTIKGDRDASGLSLEGIVTCDDCALRISCTVLAHGSRPVQEVQEAVTAMLRDGWTSPAERRRLARAYRRKLGL